MRRRPRTRMNRWVYRILLAHRYLGVAFLLWVFWIPTPAQAERECIRHTYVWRHGSCNVSEGFFSSCRNGHWRRVCVRWSYYDEERYYRRGPERVYGYERREEPPRGHCMWGERMGVWGTDHLKQETAEIAAQDAWSRQVEDRWGVRYADIQNAAEMTRECVRKVPSGGFQAGEAALGLRHYICEVQAVPCRAPKEAIDEDTRGKRLHEKADDVRRGDPPARIESGVVKRRFWPWRRRYE